MLETTERWLIQNGTYIVQFMRVLRGSLEQKYTHLINYFVACVVKKINRHIKNFKFIWAKIDSNWPVSNLEDRMELHGMVQNERLS